MSESARERRLTAKPRYTEQLVSLVSEDHFADVENIADARGVSKAVIVREALDIALPKLKANLRRAMRDSDDAPTDEIRARSSR